MKDILNVWGDIQEYKGIKLYPARMINIYEFYDYVQCLLIEKNKIQDINVIKMSYLDFLFVLSVQEQIYHEKLMSLLQLVFKEQKFEFKFTEDEKISLIVEDVKLNGSDFENIRSIILKQNDVSYDEDIYDSEIEEALKEAQEFMSKKNGKASATIEERIISMHCLSGASFKEIENYTIFQFNKILERFCIIKNYEVFSPLIAQYGESKDIQHFLDHIEEKGRYADVIMSKDDFDKITADNDIFSKA